jgi:hypothetical protein
MSYSSIYVTNYTRAFQLNIFCVENVALKILLRASQNKLKWNSTGIVLLFGISCEFFVFI